MTKPSASDVALSAPFAPLAGIRIVDFSTNMAGPYATMILAQLGADVIKVEAPTGDDARAWAPDIDGASVVHRHMNAGKRGIGLDLRTDAGRKAALAIAARSDVLLQSMRPGVAERIGIGEDAVRAVNPDILYYALNAFGAGPVGRDLPGYDPLVQAFTGIMRMNGHDGAPPVRCAPSVVDLGSGQWVAMGVVAAMLAKHRGQPVRAMETALIDTAFSLVAYQATTARMTGQRPKRAGSGNPIAAPYEVYPAGDGDLMIAAPNQRLWERVAGVLGLSELVDDSRFLTVADRSRNNSALTVCMTAALAREDVAVWVGRLRAAGVPVTPVAGLEEAVVADATTERGTFADLDGVPHVRLPWIADGQPVNLTRPAPRLGEHTTDILQECGFDRATITTMLREGAAIAEHAVEPAQ
ncbi:CaiB/BaiF CoA transferase family protein [Sphingomonas sp. RB1R13]|uniref:CaiB/BaiF CoA transferase family protein n=1 Tax=Sphingomonas sp. RB1R13 TaxID=3096159 RepID=UPI002FC72596